MFDQAMDRRGRSDADLRAGRCQHVDPDGRRLERRQYDLTATYDVSDANVLANGVTVDVTGAQDANGNAQTDYTAAGRVQRSTPSIRSSPP